jgi:tripartite-type tricarboxylate transporter receptor subunit TctC
VVEASPDGDTLLLANNLLLALNEATGDWPFAIEALRPIAKITLGISVALVAPAGSEIIDWQALLDLAVERSLRLAMAGREVEDAVARAMLEGVTGIGFETVATADHQASAAEIAAGRADLAIVATNSIEDHAVAAGAALRPLVTFGAKRSPLYPDTPTFAELSGDDSNDFTYSFAIFGPAGLPDGVAATLADAIQQVCSNPEALVAASATELPLDCHDARIVHETIERDLGVARRVAAYLGEN